MQIKRNRKNINRFISASSSKSGKVFIKQCLIKALCLSLIVNMLTLSTPAAPAVIVGKTSELAQAIRFRVLSSTLAIDYPNWSLGTFISSIRNTNEDAGISRIQIFPGSVAIKKGEQVTFSAVGYDFEDEPLSGIGFNWTVTDTGRGLAPKSLLNSTFEAKATGTFTVTAESDGQQAEVVVTVAPPESGSSSRTNLQTSGVKTISSRSAGASKEEKTDAVSIQKGTQTENTSSSNQTSNLLPDEGGWNNGNWQSFDDPGNGPGNPPGHPADNGAGNGNFQLSAPIISLPGRGIDLSLSLNYNSRLWNKSGSELTYDIDRGFPGPGWSLGFGKIMDMGANGGSMLIDADGTRHSFTGTLSQGGTTIYFNGHTTDGTFIDYNSYRYPSGIREATVKMPNGTTIFYGAPGDGAVYPVRILDANGNYINITYKANQGPNIENVTDTMGRNITFNYDSLGRLISITAPRMINQGAIYGKSKIRTLIRFHYRPLPLTYSFASGMNAVVRNSTPSTLDAVYYPATQTGYWFGGADSTSPDYTSYYSTYGMLTKFEEQRGMSWVATSEEQGKIVAGQMSKRAVYNYPLTTSNESGRTNGVNLTDAPTYDNVTESWDGMDDTPAVTSYNIQQNSSPRVTSIIQPNGALSRQYAYNYSSLPDTDPNKYKDGLIYLDESYVPDASGTFTFPNITGTFKLVGKSNVTWEKGDYSAARPVQTEVFDENNLKVTTTYDYTNGRFNQVLKSCNYDNGGVKLQCSVAQYQNNQNYIDRHIFNLAIAKGIENPDGTKASWTEYEYDNYQSQPLTNTPNVIQHDYTFDPYTTMTRDGDCITWETYECGTPYEPMTCERCTTYQQVSAYDSSTSTRGNLTKTTSYADAQNLTGAISEVKSYDITGNTIIASTSCCQQTSFQYTAGTQYAYPESQTRGSSDPNSPNRITLSVSYSFETGLVTQGTDADGRVSTKKYNPDTLRQAFSYYSTGAYKSYGYDDTAMTITEETYEASGFLAEKNINYLNGVGLIKREEVLGANNGFDIIETKYNKLGQVWKQSRPYRVGDTVQWSETLYDNQGRIIKVIEPDGSYTQAVYNESQRPDSASAFPGKTIRVTDAWGRQRWGRYDQLDRLVEVAEPNPNGNGSVLAAGSFITKYKYDTLANLVETQQGDQYRYFKYDSLGRLTRQKPAEKTATLNDAGTYVGSANQGARWSDSFVYDSRSNLTQKTDARGVKTNYVYYDPNTGSEDPLNRLQVMWYDLSGPRDPGLTIHAAYGITYEYMTSGDKTRIKKAEATGLVKEEYTYDVEGRISERTQTVAYRENYPMTTSYIYDTLDRVKDVLYPAEYGLTNSPRKLVQHTYDSASRLTALKVDGQQQAGDILYNASDQITSINIGTSGTNQINESYIFDPQTGLLTNQKVQRGQQNLLDLSYDYQRNNSIGTLNGKTGHLSKIVNNLDANKNREYEYDALGRLTKAKGGNNLWQQQYSYDRYGNRQNVTASGTAADNTTIPRDGIASLSYNTTNNRIITAGFEYDVAGNQTRALAEDGQTWLRFEYDSANRLVVVKRDDGTMLQSFNYGQNNARLMSYDYSLGQLKIYFNSGGITLSEYTEFSSAVPTWTKSFVYLGESLLSTVTPNGQGGEYTEFNHPDQLGTRTITNQQGGTSYEQATLPFGTALNAESTITTNNKRFTSYDRSRVTGLDYAVNRTYDSKQGRFTQVDPFGMGATSLTSPQSLNLYSYCGNDPINHTDPNGLFWGSLFRWIGKAIKVIMIAVAVIIAVAAMIAMPALAPAIGYGLFVKAFVLSGLLLTSALAPPKIGAVIGAISGTILSGAGIITNFGSTESGKFSIWQRLLAASNYVGAIANNFSSNNKRRDTYDDIAFDSLFVAYQVIRSDLKCAKFFGLTDKRGRFSEKKFKAFTKSITYVQKPTSGGPFATTNGNTITLYGGFYNDGYFKVSPQPNSLKDPRQGRAQTILHELAHVKGLLIAPDNYGYPNDPNAPANKNEKTILDNCGEGLSKIPSY